MKKAKYKEEIEALLSSSYEVTTSDFFEVMKGCPEQTVYSRIRALERDGRIFASGHGKFNVGTKMKYAVKATPWMMEVNEFLNSQCIGMDHCVMEHDGNIIVDVFKNDMADVLHCLKGRYDFVDEYKKASAVDGLKGYILVRQMVSEAPVIVEDSMTVPSLEKTLVDMVAEGKCSEDEVQKCFQRAFEVYQLNTSTLLRYASRRNVRPLASAHIASLNQERIEMIGKIQRFFETQPVERAWLFGSFSRQEERPDSDVDLLVDFVPESDISLMDHVRISYELQDFLNRDIDLVTNGTLLPFAVNSANHDKYKIYERTYKRSRTA